MTKLNTSLVLLDVELVSNIKLAILLLYGIVHELKRRIQSVNSDMLSKLKIPLYTLAAFHRLNAF